MLTSTMLSLALTVMPSVQWETDTTFAAAGATRLEVRDVRGSVRVTGWDRPEIRVRADHGSRDMIQIEHRGGAVSLRATREFGQPVVVDYVLSVPRGMALRMDGIGADFSISGVRADVQAASVEGDIDARDVGTANLATVDGDITLAGATGAVRVSTTDGDLRLSGLRGNVAAVTLDGDVFITDVNAASVEASTIDGEVLFDGVIQDGGRYRLGSHDGDITLRLQAGANASISVATFDGEFQANFPVQMQRGQMGRRFSFTLGSGSAVIELEAFDGTIRLERRP